MTIFLIVVLVAVIAFAGGIAVDRLVFNRIFSGDKK